MLWLWDWGRYTIFYYLYPREWSKKDGVVKIVSSTSSRCLCKSCAYQEASKQGFGLYGKFGQV